MKKRNKIVGAICALALIGGALVFPLADEPSKVDIKVQESDGTVHTNSTYTAYRLFDLTITGEGDDALYKYSISNQTVKSAIISAMLQMDDKYSDLDIQGGDYNDKFNEIADKISDNEVITWVSNLENGDVQTFADYMWMKLSAQSSSKISDICKESENGEFSDMPQGYYLIVESKLNDTGSVYSLVMLDTAGNEKLEVTTKREMPTVTKKVKEVNDSTGSSAWQDAADFDITDTIDFKIDGTIPDNLRDMLNYNDSSKFKYTYAFHDKEAEGLTFNKSSVVVKVDGNNIDDTNYTLVVNGEENNTRSITDDCTFEIIFEDITKVEEIKAGSTITVEYNATLNSSAKIGHEGNENQVRLEFTDNPYGREGSTKYPNSFTNWDKVKVFTYEVDVKKVDGAGMALPGATFKLSKIKDSSSSTYEEVAQIPTTDTSTTSPTEFVFKGLDAGKYKLEEVVAPAGYNKAADIIFEIEATYDTESEDPNLTALSVKENPTFVAEKTSDDDNGKLTGKLTVTVENLTGKELPSTGGMGTTIFYVVGAVLVLGGSVLFIARKKTEKE